MFFKVDSGMQLLDPPHLFVLLPHGALPSKIVNISVGPSIKYVTLEGGGGPRKCDSL